MMTMLLWIQAFFFFFSCAAVSTTAALTTTTATTTGDKNLGRNNDNCIGRRALFDRVAAAAVATAFSSFVPPSRAASASASSSAMIAAKFEKDILAFPPVSSASEFNGVDNTYFPEWLGGEWDVTQTLVSVETPLGLKYIGGPNGSLSIAEASMKEASSRIGKPVELKLRYLPTRWGVAEDRLYNTAQRLNAFAEKNVVASVSYADVGGSNRQSVLAMGGTESDPLQTTLVYFKGPAAQKSFLVSHGGGTLDEDDVSSFPSWAGYEVQRSIFALTNQNTAPPVTTDTEYIWKFTKTSDTTVTGRLRIAGYLNAQSDTLYFDARNRAVSLQDYTLEMTKKTI